MARKSRKYPELTVPVSKDTVGYIRLSVFNRDSHGSVENQKLIIEEWGNRLRQSSMWTYAFLFSSLMVAEDTLLPHSASVISSTLRTETPARYISMRASSTLLSRRRYRSMMAVSKETPFKRGIWSVTSPDVVVRFRL